VALPSPRIVFSINGGRKTPIQHWNVCEAATMTGSTKDGRIESVKIIPGGLAVANYAFDATPARLVNGLITERGVLRADREALAQAFSERAERVG
jgi:methylthioribose-1-phosphate isomerase